MQRATSFSSAFVSLSVAKLAQEFRTADPALYPLHFSFRLSGELDIHQPECDKYRWLIFNILSHACFHIL
jgi:hypothetical protein